MGVATKIEWCHHTFNPWWGCVKVSPGCTNCYAEALDRRTHGTSKHVTAGGETREPHWGKDAPRRFFGDKHWREPLKWNRDAKAAGERRRVFCASMADVFEDRRDLDAQRARLWALIDETPDLCWLLLTKRPQNIKHLAVSETHLNRSNVWLGTTVESPETVWRIDALRTTPAWIRFLSVEPQIAPFPSLDLYGIEWVIQGGESGPGARVFEPSWARWMRDECKRQGVAYFLKQLGARQYGKEWEWASMLADPKGGDMSEWPADLRVRELPA